jgi:hypothetical protein
LINTSSKTNGQVLTWNSTNNKWQPENSGSGGVTGVSVATANGLAGTSDGNLTNPTLTLSTTATGILKGNGTSISSAVSGTDYLSPSSIGVTVQGYDANTTILGNSTTGSGNIVRATSPTTTNQTLSGNVTISGGRVISTSDVVVSGDLMDLNLTTVASYTASRSGSTVTATVGTFTTADVGRILYWITNDSYDIITAYTSSTQVTVDHSGTILSQSAITLGKPHFYIDNVNNNAVIGRVTVTVPANGSTLSIADGKTLSAPLDATVSGTNTGDQTDATLTFSDVTTNNSTTLKHGFLPKLSGNSTQYLDGNGNYSTPTAGVANSYSLTTFTSQTSVTVTHNFGSYPAVQVLDNTGALMLPLTVTHSSTNAFTVTFTSSTSGSIIATIGSPQPQTVTVASGNYTVLTTDYFVKCTGAASTITLPTAVGNTGRVFQIKNASNGTITLNTTSSQTIDGSLTQTLFTHEAVSVFSDGSNYWYY